MNHTIKNHCNTVPPFKFKVDDLVKEGRVKTEQIQEINEWLELTSNLPKMCNEQVAIFLIACNNVVDATKDCIVAYFRLRSASPELFANRNIDNNELVHARKVSKIAVMPRRTDENYALIMAGLKDTTYYNFFLDAQSKTFYIILDALLHENPPSGLIVIIDLKGVGLMHLTRFKIIIVRKFFKYLQEALPCKLKYIHILNTSYIFDKAMMILKPFMNKEIFDMIQTHPPNMNMEEFHKKHIPSHLLPSEIGGSLPSLDALHDETLTYYRNIRSFLDSLDQQVDIYENNC